MSRPLPDAAASEPPDSTTASFVPPRLGRYQVVREVGKGSMGCVFLAIDPRIDRRVAIKVLAPGLSAYAPTGDELRRRFMTETRAAGRLNHPNIVAVHDAGLDEASGLPYIAMEWIDGGSLEAEIARRGPLPPEEAVAIVKQIALALDHAHSHGMIHRDVKPANILLTSDGQAKLTDFGVAKLSAGTLQTAAGLVFGTPAYMSPEQIQDEEIDRRSDLFSLGACLYESLTGECPFLGRTTTSTAFKVVHVDPRPPSGQSPEMAQLAGVLERALAKSPGDRFRSGSELAQHLDEALARGRSSPAQVVTKPRPRRAPVVARRRWTRTAALALLGLLGFSAALLVERQGEPELPEAPSAPGRAAGAALPGHAGRGTATPALEVGVSSSRDLAPVPGTAARSFLEISHANRLRSGRLTVLVDGEAIWSEQLKGPRNPLKRTVGVSVKERLPLSPGKHRVTVRLQGEKGKLDERQHIDGSFTAGETRRLRVVLRIVPRRALKLRWQD